MTIGQAWREGLKRLQNYSDAPDIDSQQLLLHILKESEIAFLISHSDDLLNTGQVEQFFTAIANRATGKPLAYILGWTEFFGRRFTVSEDVLIPRPATEELIETALPIIQRKAEELGRKLVVADIGCGSGCIGITLLLESNFIEHVHATDISAVAISVAHHNAELNTISDRITFHTGNMFEPLQHLPIDFIVSNPPYVPSSELDQTKTIPTAGLSFEPRLALDGGQDGLHYVKEIASLGIPAVVETLGGKIEVLEGK